MADWTDIQNDTIEPDAPLLSATMFALRDNPKAIAEGASGAPRIADGALKDTATNTGRDWVLARTALASAGAVGAYAFLARSGTDITNGFGDTQSGDTLAPSNAGATTSGSVSGTWRCMGFQDSTQTGTEPASSTLWLRIA